MIPSNLYSSLRAVDEPKIEADPFKGMEPINVAGSPLQITADDNMIYAEMLATEYDYDDDCIVDDSDFSLSLDAMISDVSSFNDRIVDDVIIEFDNGDEKITVEAGSPEWNEKTSQERIVYDLIMMNLDHAEKLISLMTSGDNATRVMTEGSEEDKEIFRTSLRNLNALRDLLEDMSLSSIMAEVFQEEFDFHGC